MRCVKRAESEHPGDDDAHLQLRKVYFLDLWRHCWPHYTRKECPLDCPCNQWLQGEADDVSNEQQEMIDTVANLMDGNNYEVVREEVLTFISLLPTDSTYLAFSLHLILIDTGGWRGR